MGVLTIQEGDPPEVCLLVHPEHRRRGIGRRRLEQAKVSCQQHGATELLLTVTEQSAVGEAFAEAVGARYRFAEYGLELEHVPEHQDWEVPLVLRVATRDDAATVAHRDGRVW